MRALAAISWIGQVRQSERDRAQAFSIHKNLRRRIDVRARHFET